MPDRGRIALAFASVHGQTGRIAERIAATMRGQGLEVEVHDLRAHEKFTLLKGFDGIVLGSSVHAGHHLDPAVAFARDHRTLLGTIPSAFFSVCLAAADDDEESRATTREYRDQFVEETGWEPGVSVSFAGAIVYSHYGPFERVLMRLIMRHKGHGEIKWDQEFTDWDAVDGFARDFASRVSEHVARAPAMETTSR
jgi:menaquinone-dependent protoporphyrinogen oxidase